jgi:hypothetical protein
MTDLSALRFIALRSCFGFSRDSRGKMLISTLANQALFMGRRYIEGVSVPDQPQFSDCNPACRDFFIERLSQANFYLEYGSGGSTVQAARMNKRFLSVESDLLYMRAVRKKIESLGAPRDAIIHADVGVVEYWGRPFIKRRSRARVIKWANYASLPWAKLTERPNLVLVDGRFRVHCALFCIRALKDDFELLIDDYFDRSHYHEVERFARLDQAVGNMATFRPKQFNENDINVAIERFASVYD